MSRVAILTQPLGANYGGILQAFALQHVLREMGHQPITIDRRGSQDRLRSMASLAKGGLLWITGKQRRIRRWPTPKESETICRHTNRFVSEHITRSVPIKTTDQLRHYAEQESFDAFVVGSDQVWRKAYSPCMPNFFLDFLPDDSPAKRIAYAASFGVSEWEFTEEETQLYARLAKRFDLISVREDSAVALCREHLGVEATHVLDPTMLVDRSVYEELAMSRYAHPSKGDLFCYILDRTPEKSRLVRETANEQGLTPFELLPREYRSLAPRDDLSEAVMPPVEQWLRSFMDAKYIITDSFHGTVFSILFEKPCIVIQNASRGNDRFQSLLKILNLPPEGPSQFLDFRSDEISDHLAELRHRSLRLLSQSTPEPTHLQKL